MSISQFALVVLTLNAEATAEKFVSALQSQTLQPLTLLVLDSHSTDKTRGVFESVGANVQLVERSEFDHGTTRQLAIEKCARDTDIVVFMTQDAILADNTSLETLINAFQDESVGAAYGRQLPRIDANPIEAHARIFNYPPESQVKSSADIKQQGIKTCFMSNSFAAYRFSALQEVGGFPDNNIVSEETYVAAKMLENGWKIKLELCTEPSEFGSCGEKGLSQPFVLFGKIIFNSYIPNLPGVGSPLTCGPAEGGGESYLISLQSATAVADLIVSNNSGGLVTLDRSQRLGSGGIPSDPVMTGTYGVPGQDAGGGGSCPEKVGILLPDLSIDLLCGIGVMKKYWYTTEPE